ncbi:MAG: hypothetical protein JWQ39_2494 [Glaciihabitans sp.]|nr:hypothetical protein [Glaciihabitans sp.]
MVNATIRRTPKGVRLIGAAVLAISLILLTGCSSSPKSQAPTSAQAILSGPQLVSVYHSTVKSFKLPLPKGDSIPENPPKNLGQNSGQIGAAKAPVYFYWLCTWEREYLVAFAANDSPREAIALKRISSFDTTDFAKTYVDDPTHGWRTHVVDPAKLGDPSGIRDDMASGCVDFGIAIP